MANPPPLRKELLVFGIKRSGNHALIEHLLGHISDSLPPHAISHPRRYHIHLNNVQTLPPAELPLPVYGNTQIISWENRYEILRDSACLWPCLSKRPNVIQRPIVVLRDPYNWFASLRRKRLEWRNLKEDYLPLWISYAHRFFVQNVEGVFPCKYNQWFSDPDYRRELADFIGEPPTDCGMDRVRSIGSSFDGKKFDGRARDMQVLERWKSLTQEDWSLLNRYPEIKELSQAIFNFVPEHRQ